MIGWRLYRNGDCYDWEEDSYSEDPYSDEIYIYIYIYMYVYIHVYIYIYRERERETSI
jgi:hypothetical protein